MVVGDAARGIRVVELRGGVADPEAWVVRRVKGTFSPSRSLVPLDGGDSVMMFVASVEGDSQLVLVAGDGSEQRDGSTSFFSEWAFPGAASAEEEDGIGGDSWRVETRNSAMASGASFVRSLAPIRDATPLPIATYVGT